MKRLLLLAVGLLAVAACTPPVDWERDFTPVAVPGTDWAMEPCEGDGPFVCVVDPDGEQVGFVEHLSFETDLRDLAGLEDHLHRFYESIIDDRATGCGPGYRLDTDRLESVVLDRVEGRSYGWEATNAAGDVVEKTYGLMAIKDGRLHVVSAAAYDDGACLSNEGEFATVADLRAFAPRLRESAVLTPLR